VDLVAVEEIIVDLEVLVLLDKETMEVQVQE
jgi:hypothetical protein